MDAPTDEEETKRLVYVAFTRARDRLYLASSLDEGPVYSRTGEPGGRSSVHASQPVRHDPPLRHS